MAKSQSQHVGDQIDELTECAICTETLSTPKVIPCLHTFCLKCLETYCVGIQPGNSMDCPLCRCQFIIPVGGLSKLRTNIFVEKLMEAGNCLKSMSSPFFDQCSCLSGQDIVIYCLDCKVAACYRCKIQIHRSHQSTDFVAHCEQQIQQVADDVDKVKLLVPHLSSRSSEFEEGLSKLVDKFEETEEKIRARSILLKQQVEKQSEWLLAKLADQKSLALKKADTVKKHHEAFAEKVHNFIDISECLNEQILAFSSSNLISLTEDLHSQMQELIDEFKHSEISTIIGCSKVEFEDYKENIVIGEISVQEQISSEETIELADNKQPLFDFGIQSWEWAKNIPQLNFEMPSTVSLPEYSAVHSTPPSKFVSTNVVNSLAAHLDKEIAIKNANVTGLVALGKRLFIAFEDSKEVHVYDCTNLKFQKSLTVEPLKDPYDITGCGCVLYISERTHAEIHEFRLTTHTTSTWSVAGKCMSLSMVGQQQVLATCCGQSNGFIAEYSRDGHLIRKIVLPNDVDNPRHAICLSNGHLIVCHGSWLDKKWRRVCLISSNGDVLKSIGGESSTLYGRLNEPIRLAHHKSGFILLLDLKNSIVLVFNENLKFVGELFSNSRETALITMGINDNADQLFVAEFAEPDSIINCFSF